MQITHFKSHITNKRGRMKAAHLVFLILRRHYCPVKKDSIMNGCRYGMSGIFSLDVNQRLISDKTAY